jgi:hypothetical protein
MSIDINDKEQPKHNEYINDEYELREAARQLLKCKLINAGIEFARSADSRAFEEFYRYMSVNIPKQPEPSWTSKAIEDAQDLIREYFIDEIVQALVDGSEVSSDMYNDYDNGDGIFHETINDRYYHRTDAMELLDELYEHEETDSGVWERLDWEGVIQAKAAYTYGNAVMSEWNDIIENINSNIDRDDVASEVADKILEDPEKQPVNYNEMEDSDLVEYVVERYEEEYNSKLEAALRALVLKELE